MLVSPYPDLIRWTLPMAGARDEEQDTFIGVAGAAAIAWLRRTRRVRVPYARKGGAHAYPEHDIPNGRSSRPTIFSHGLGAGAGGSVL